LETEVEGVELVLASRKDNGKFPASGLRRRISLRVLLAPQSREVYKSPQGYSGTHPVGNDYTARRDDGKVKGNGASFGARAAFGEAPNANNALQDDGKKKRISMMIEIYNPVPAHHKPSQDRPNLYGAA
jgi:hypothetical protein